MSALRTQQGLRLILRLAVDNTDYFGQDLIGQKEANLLIVADKSGAFFLRNNVFY